MDTDYNNLADDNASDEDCEQALDFGSDEGARVFNQMIDEGSAYLAANPQLAKIPAAMNANTFAPTCVIQMRRVCSEARWRSF